jgi:omega-6 fatty acid desaturase (delta-12 desaturase)
MSDQVGRPRTKTSRPDWFAMLDKFSHADRRRAIGQLLNTMIPYAGLWVLMIMTVAQGYSYVITLALALVAAALQVRIFIFFHDCCHNAFFKSKRANRALGLVTGILTFTPFDDWRRAHAVHHATAGDLDRRGTGDVFTMTVDEYLSASRWRQFGYRLFRHPLVLLGLGPIWIFLITQRFPHKDAGRRERNSVLVTNLALLAIIVAASLTIGLRTYLLVQLPVILLAGVMGIWLFYVQHQFEGVYWVRHDQWDPIRAALEGSSYYRLPKVAQWFTGNIGLHHIHHLRPRIPNYRLQECYDQIPALQQVEPLTFMTSLRSLHLRLWDEQQGKLVSFGSLWARRRPANSG